MSDHQTVRIGSDAAQVLENEAYKTAMTGLKAQIVAEWTRCPVTDREGALLLLQLVKLCDKFDSMLTGMVANGRFTQAKIDLDKERNETRSQKWLRKVNG